MKKKDTFSKRRILIFGSISIVAIVWFFSNLITYTTNIKNLKKEKLRLENELLELKESADELTNEIEKLKDPEYLARYARSEYSYSKSDGEYVIKIDENKKKDIIQITEEKNSLHKYIIGGSGVILLLIIIYIIKK